MAKLVLVPTPIGNMGDITIRALDCLKAADLILAEDTRTTGFLLHHFGIEKKCMPYHKFNEHKALPGIIEKMAACNITALVSDAGTPGISDPGYLLVNACVEANIYVEALPGPTALIPALVLSGLPLHRFTFEGFLPVKKGRQTLLKQLSAELRTMVFYESPHRILKTLQEMTVYFGGERRAFLIREITKKFETSYRGTLASLSVLLAHQALKGELVLVVEGALGGHEKEQAESTKKAWKKA